MKLYDLFICYRGQDASSEFAYRLNEELKKKSYIRTFFAPEILNFGANFKTIIPEIMPTVKVMILLLNKNFFSHCSAPDDIVLYELKHAVKNQNLTILPIIFNGFDYEQEDLSMFNESELERFKHNSAINYHGIYDSKIIENTIIPAVENILRPINFKKDLQKRRADRYVGGASEEELFYLKNQRNMLELYDKEVYDKIILDKKYVLDIGCNDGFSTYQNFERYNNLTTVIGIDKAKECIETANVNYSNDRFKFYCEDIESENFESRLNEIKQENKIVKFDFINITMVLLHLVNPFKLLRTLRKHLNPNGILFIRDIDDSFNFAFPDSDKIFERLGAICSYCDVFGYRNSGKEIYSLLKNSGYSKVKIAKQGLNTSEMNVDDKETLFNIYYGYIPTAMKTMLEKNPDNLEIIGDKKWVDEIIDEALIRFLKTDFIFSLGYIIYLAQI